MQFLALASKVFWLGIFMPCKRMVQCIVARETDVAQLAIIEVGKSPQRSSTITPPSRRDNSSPRSRENAVTILLSADRKTR
jgi:hypothetical protein